MPLWLEMEKILHIFIQVLADLKMKEIHMYCKYVLFNFSRYTSYIICYSNKFYDP